MIQFRAAVVATKILRDLLICRLLHDALSVATLRMFMWRRPRALGRATPLLRGLNFTSLLHGSFLALLVGLDPARLCYKRVSPSECVYGKFPALIVEILGSQ